jgi:fatty acid desaturase
MEDNAKLIESLIEKAADYGKTTFELAKLKALDKTSDIASSFIPHSVVFILIASFLLFLNFGLAYWVGEILGKIYLGFFIVAAFYVITGLVLHFFFHKRIKNHVWNYIIKQVLK